MTVFSLLQITASADGAIGSAIHDQWRLKNKFSNKKNNY